MSIATQLAALSMFAIIGSSSAPGIDVDARAPNGPGQRFDNIWMVVSEDDQGNENLAQAKLTTGEYAPLIAADAARLGSIVRQLHTSQKRGIFVCNWSSSPVALTYKISDLKCETLG